MSTETTVSEQGAAATMLVGAYLGAGNIVPRQRDIPRANAGDIIIKVMCAGICGTDMHSFRHGGFMPEGMTIGHEFSGVVTEVGDGVEGITPGLRVTANPMVDHIGLFADGAFAEYVRIPNAKLDHSVFTLPDSIDFEQGALIEPLAVALRGIKQCQLDDSSHVLVQGLGTIGLCVIMLARQRGVKKIVAVDRAGPRLALAEKLGAIPHELGSDGLEQLLADQFGVCGGMLPGPKLDLVIDATGSEAALAQAINLLQPRGQLLVLGTYPKPITLDMTFFVAKEIRMFASLAYEQEFPEAINLLAEAALDESSVDMASIDIASLISHRFSLQHIEQAFQRQADPTDSVKVLLDCDLNNS
jgi:(R,R)-butanediol dehydrogenase/meso-butanediol dehydrogenase/diacetyl reductase